MTMPPAAWYDDPSTPGRQRWWDGAAWTDHFQSAPGVSSVPPRAPEPQPWAQQPQQQQGFYSQPSNSTPPLNVVHQVVYTRQTTPHSLVAWILISLFTGGIGLIWMVYYTLSDHHYWRG